MAGRIMSQLFNSRAVDTVRALTFKSAMPLTASCKSAGREPWVSPRIAARPPDGQGASTDRFDEGWRLVLDIAPKAVSDGAVRCFTLARRNDVSLPSPEVPAGDVEQAHVP